MILSRRAFSTGAAALAFEAAIRSATAAGGLANLPPVADVAHDSTSLLSDLKARGVQVVFRYYASGFQSSLPTKRLTPAERDSIFKAGLGLGLVYQYHNNDIANLHYERGKADAKYVLNHARNVIQQPPGSAVYFGVDGDWPSFAQLRQIKNYFGAINEVFKEAEMPFRIGVYGSGLTCRELAADKLSELFWLPKSTGFAETPKFYNSGLWTMYQNMLDVSIGRNGFDTNISNPSGNVGAFDSVGAPIVIEAPAATTQRRRFLGSGTDLMSSPQSSGRQVGKVRRRDNVVLIDEQDQWSLVSMNERGSSSGYVPTRFLVSMGAMPV